MRRLGMLWVAVMFLTGCFDIPPHVNRAPTLKERVRAGDGKFCRDSANKYTDRCANFRFHLQIQAREDARRSARFGH